MFSFARFGNDLYTGRRSVNIVGRRRIWYSVAAGCVLISILAVAFLGLNEGVELKGGSEFQVSGVKVTTQSLGVDAVKSVDPDATPLVTKLGTGSSVSMQVETDKLSNAQTSQAALKLATAYGVPSSNVTSSFVGPSWGHDVSIKALQGLVVFLVLVTAVISLYFRTWTMAVAGLVALLHDLVLTVGVYALVGFTVTPASVIGFLTILGYSLYDTVVVFDKVRENTAHIMATTKRTYAEAANLAVNQTLVRSINTSVVALLPVASILVIGSILIGTGTLDDLSLALFVGIAAGTYSSIFIATPLLVDLRRRDPEIRAQEARVLKRRAEQATAPDQVAVPAGGVADLDDLDAEPTWEPDAARSGGQRQQPRRNRPRTGGRR